MDTSSFEKTGLIQMTTEEAMRLLNLAASLLQANIKMFLQRKKYLLNLKQNKASVKIQAAWRGFHTRNLNKKIMHLKNHHFMNTIQQSLHELNSENKLSIQSIFDQQNFIVLILEQLLQLRKNVVSCDVVVCSEADGHKLLDTPTKVLVSEENNNIDVQSLIKATTEEINKLIVTDSSLESSDEIKKDLELQHQEMEHLHDVRNNVDTVVEIVDTTANSENHLSIQTIHEELEGDELLVSSISDSVTSDVNTSHVDLNDDSFSIARDVIDGMLQEISASPIDTQVSSLEQLNLLKNLVKTI